MQNPIALTASDLDAALTTFLRRYAYVRRKNIEHFAHSFCCHFGLAEIPRDPFNILPYHFGITLQPALLPRPVRASWIRLSNTDSYLIHYSNHSPHHRLSLVLWHEFFEIMSAHQAFRTRLTTEEECDLATLFAVNVTMPRQDILAAAHELGHPHIQDKTGVLASRFGVSYLAMKLRLAQLGLAPRPLR